MNLEELDQESEEPPYHLYESEGFYCYHHWILLILTAIVEGRWSLLGEQPRVEASNYDHVRELIPVSIHAWCRLTPWLVAQKE